jgi:endoglucanase
VFTDWLEANNVKGYIGEVGWPEDPVAQAQWNAVADRWYEDADAANLWVTAWSTGEWWGTDYNLAIYEDRIAGSGVDTPNAQASILESHPSTWRYLRGINVAGGEFASPAAEMEASFSNANPGLYGVDYHYDSQGTFYYLSSRGIRVVRIPFRWERVQPSLGKRLAHSEVRRLKRVVDRARTAGLKVVLDMHNYGAYYLSDGDNGVRCPIGSAQCTVAQFADVWKRLSLHFKDIRAVAGYGLMNEPVGLPDSTERSAAEVWERASQRAVDAIRANGDSHLVLVSGYNWSGVQGWSTQHPDAWIHDSANRFRYEAHHYWDQDHSGDYPDSYLTEVALAEGG